MPRKYIKKGKKYPPERVDAALNDVREKKMSLREASRQYAIEQTYLFRQLHNMHQGIQGRKTVLSASEELSLANNLKTMAKWGFPLSKLEVKNVVADFVHQNEIKTPFGKEGPGDDWFQSFTTRHRLTLKKPEPLEAVRRKATGDPFVIYHFYDLVEEQITLMDLKEKPDHIWNLDETGFNLDPSRIKAVGEKGVKLHRNIQGSGKENLTVLACVSAAGKLLPPLIIYQASKLWTSWKGDQDIPNTFYSCSEKGWITAEIFQDLFHQFCKYVKERPLLLIFDGHLSHLDSGTIEKAVKENITIIKLPAHTTDVIQPLDKCCFRPLKLMWDKELIQWQRENQRKLSKCEFANLLCKIWNDGIKPETIIRGFSSTGIFPVNRNQYPIERLDIEKLKRYNEERQNKELRNEEAFQLDTDETENRLLENTEVEIIESNEPKPGCSRNMSFENILLKKIGKTNPSTNKRRKIDQRGKVITSEEYLSQINAKDTKFNSKEKNTKKDLAKKIRKEDTSDSTEDGLPENQSDSLEDLMDIIVYSALEENEVQLHNVHNIKVGEFVLTNFKGGKRNSYNYKYVCTVLKILGTEVEIMGFKSINNEKKEFKMMEKDISTVELENIEAILPVPQIVTVGRGTIKYVFDNPVPVSEQT